MLFPLKIYFLDFHGSRFRLIVTILFPLVIRYVIDLIGLCIRSQTAFRSALAADLKESSGIPLCSFFVIMTRISKKTFQR